MFVLFVDQQAKILLIINETFSNIVDAAARVASSTMREFVLSEMIDIIPGVLAHAPASVGIDRSQKVI